MVQVIIRKVAFDNTSELHELGCILHVHKPALAPVPYCATLTQGSLGAAIGGPPGKETS